MTEFPLATNTMATPPAASAASAAGIAVRSNGDRAYRVITTLFALLIPALLCLIAIEVFAAGWPALHKFGIGFFTRSEWDAVDGKFGAAPAIYGTLVSSALALLIATPLAVGVAIFLSEFAPRWLRQPVAFFVDLLAAIPSVVYGLWGILVFVPFVREHVMTPIKDTLHLGGVPLFSGVAYGPSMLAAGGILAIMILPYISAVTREVLLAVPRSQREAALALGATRWEMIWDAVLPYARSGIIGGIILGLGRALGETMAVTMVIGNRAEISASLFAPAYTMASLIANEFSEATSDLHVSALMAVGAGLFIVTIIVNIIARWLVWRVGRIEG
ncbi:MAG TPA: phosphate ABC transporter permease subunit PstC [Gemmatimonadaceae bacterium]|nr:phosphate ABC transporter permease subunit PstC [Gemmatimonadaceae bacterium]